MVWTEAPARAKVAGHPLLPIPTATASLPDSTRDLKPANVKVKADGTVKVLDFGLAKAFQPEASGASASESPTISLTAAATQMGMVLGTAAYMSPEQAKGKVVDTRADVWALGVVLYEMLTGQKPFVGEDVSDTLALVLKFDPDWEVLPPETPASIRRLLRRCLTRETKFRLREAGSAIVEIRESEIEADLAGPVAPSAPPRLQIWQRPLPGLVAVLLVAVGAGLAVWSLMRPGPRASAAVARFSIVLGPDQRFTAPGRHLVALSPDGLQFVYVADGRLYLRRLDQLQARPIAGTEGATNPFVSSDGEWIGFWADGQLKRVAMSGGAAVRLSDAETLHGASWGEDDMILLGQGRGAILRVPGAGGIPERVIEVEEGEFARSPQMLPGGDWVLFTLRPGSTASAPLLWDQAQIVVQSLSTGERKVVLEGGYDARYLSTGHLVYALNGVLLAAPFDVHDREVTGGPVPVVEGVAETQLSGAAHFAVASTGALVYVPSTVLGGLTTGSQGLGWVDRQGVLIPAIDDWDVFGYPRLSPDDTKVAAAASNVDDNPDIWIRDLAAGADTRLTEVASSAVPAWMPDGTSVTFTSNRSGAGLYSRPADRSGEAELLVTPSGSGLALSGGWSLDGQTLLYSDSDDLWMLPLDGDPVRFLATEFDERAPRLSPDGQWVAYVSDQAGEARVYVQPFPDGGEVITVSRGPGTEPVWSRDGRELFYRAGNELFVAEIATVPSFSIGRPRVLFEGPYASDPIDRGFPNYDVSLDGERFLMVTRGDDSVAPTLTFVQNWLAELKERVPVN